jgi:hypothetical protein
MMLRRMWRKVASGALVAALASVGATAASAAQGGDQGARSCRNVDAYRIRSCATATLPATGLGRQLGWVLEQLAGGATTLTEAEVREHLSAEFLTVVMPPEAVIGALQGTLAGTTARCRLLLPTPGARGTGHHRERSGQPGRAADRRHG